MRRHSPAAEVKVPCFLHFRGRSACRSFRGLCGCTLSDCRGGWLAVEVSIDLLEQIRLAHRIHHWHILSELRFMREHMFSHIQVPADISDSLLRFGQLALV